MTVLHPDVKEILFYPESIATRVAKLGAEIRRDYHGQRLVVVGILRGAVMFVADLLREIEDVDVSVDFMAVSSYGADTQSSGKIKIEKDLSDPIDGKHVIIVDDIFDTGNTLNYLRKVLGERGPASVKTAALLDKPVRRNAEVKMAVDYVGFTVPNQFVVGYGLDYNQRYRNLPYIGVLKPEVYGG